MSRLPVINTLVSTLEKQAKAMQPAGDEQETASPKKKKKAPRQPSSRPSGVGMATGLGLAGAGGLGLARFMGSDEASNRLLRAVRDYNPEAFGDPKLLPPNTTDQQYYAQILSPGAQLKVLGNDVKDVMVPLRRSKAIMERLGASGYHLDSLEKAEGNSGRQHYDMYARGPIAGYFHSMKAKYRHTPVPGTEAASGKPEDYAQYMGNKLEQYFTKQPGELGQLNPYEMTTAFMPHEQQVKLLQDFHASLSPEDQALRMKVEDLDAEIYKKQTEHYLPVAKKYVDVRNLVKRLGSIGLGAGIGGSAGHVLHDAFRGEDEKGREKRDWKYWLSTLGGTAAGGFAGDYLNRKLSGTP